MTATRVDNELIPILASSATSAGIGSLILDSLGAIVLGVLGALGGWIFAKYLRPLLEKSLNKK